MTLVGCFTTHLWVDLWYQRVSVPSQFLAVLLWITTVGPLSIILDPPTAVDFSLGDKLTVTVFSVLLVQLLSSASSVQLGFFFFFFYSVLPSPSHGKGNGNPLQYSCLENPTNREAW